MKHIQNFEDFTIILCESLNEGLLYHASNGIPISEKLAD
jgi:hypothetical protein